jgi:hypothetical protein
VTVPEREGIFLDPGRPRPPGSPWMLGGLVLGLLALSPAVVLYYWFFAPLVPLVLAAFARILSTRKKSLYPVAEGLVAAAVFGVVAVIIFFAGVATVYR